MAPVGSVATFKQTQGTPQKGEQLPTTSSLCGLQGLGESQPGLRGLCWPWLVPEQRDGSGLGPGLGGPLGPRKLSVPGASSFLSGLMPTCPSKTAP